MQNKSTFNLGLFSIGDTIFNRCCPKLRLEVENSWAHPFSELVMPALPVDEIADALYCKDNGRPTKNIPTMAALLILQESFDLTVKEALGQFKFNRLWQYALGLPDYSDYNFYVSERTFYDFRARVMDKGAADLIFDSVTAHLAKAFGVDASLQRLDSTHIRTNMQKLGRLRLIKRTVHGFLKELSSSDQAAFGSLDKALVERYIKPSQEDSGYSCFSQAKPSERESELGAAAGDLFALVRRFEGQPAAILKSFQLMLRVQEEQCAVQSGPEGEIVALKPSKEVPSSSLQNPSDDYATYSGHKGQGIQAQIMETYHRDGEEGLDLITNVETETACQSDGAAVVPAILNTIEKGLAAKEILADTAYGSDENVEFAASQGVELVSPVPGKKTGAERKAGGAENQAESEDGKAGAESDPPMTADATEHTEAIESPARADGATERCESPMVGDAPATAEASECGQAAEPFEMAGPEVKEGPIALTDFGFSDDGSMNSCPMGQKAETERNKKGNGFDAHFDREACEACPCKGNCPVVIGKKKARLSYTDKELRAARRRLYEKTQEFKDRYRYRSGIEATNSQLKRQMGLGRLRVRGRPAANLAIKLKALGLNIMRSVSEFFRIRAIAA
jgi:hypothetical protein